MEMDGKYLALKQELDKLRSQFYIFYEITQAMRTTLELEEITYIILTGVTAHEGLGFNRAILFLIDEVDKKINGFMGIGPLKSSEADKIWRYIEEEKMSLEDLIKAYHKVKKSPQKPQLIEVVKKISFPLSKEAGLIFKAAEDTFPLYIKKEQLQSYRNDSLVKILDLEEFVLIPLRAQNIPIGVMLIDNCVTKRPFSQDNIKILNMFASQAAMAIKNSKTFEETLMRSHMDSLTSLWNHGYFQYKLDEELDKAKHHNENLCVIMADIDDFKQCNDLYGHQAGDTILKSVAKIIKDNSRKEDTVARYGGEEFSLIIPKIAKEEVLHIAERVRKEISKYKLPQGNHLTISIGLACFPQDGKDKESLLKKADTRLYQAKLQGKNKVIGI